MKASETDGPPLGAKPLYPHETIKNFSSQNGEDCE